MFHVLSLCRPIVCVGIWALLRFAFLKCMVWIGLNAFSWVHVLKPWLSVVITKGKIKRWNFKVGEMVSWLRSSVALVDTLGSASRTHMVVYS